LHIVFILRPNHEIMLTFLFKTKPGWVILFFFAGCYTSFAQLPQCSSIYIDQYTFDPLTNAIASTGRIYTFNPALPQSSTNPSLNSISLSGLGQLTLGLTVSEVLGSGNATLTFYTVTDDQYWYYNPATSTWVNTNHFTGSSGLAFNIASGGGYIYNLSGADGNVYVYDGTGNGTFLVNIPDFIEEGPYDLIADCAGNFYILNVTALNAEPFLRKYNHNGILLKSWTINNPNNYFLGNGGGWTAGFGVIGTTIYVDNMDANGVKSIVRGTINNTTVDFTSPSAPATLPFQTDDYPGDFGSCASSIPVTPQITITASATTVINGTPVTFSATITDGGTNPLYQWYVNNTPVAGATGNTFTYVPAQDDVVTCRLESDLPCLATPFVFSNPVTINVEGCPPAKLDYGNDFFCQQGGEVMPVFSPAGGTFSVNPLGLSINNTTGAIDISSANLGTYVITYSVSETPQCPADSAKDTVSIVLPPTAKIEMNDKDLCVNEYVMMQTAAVPGYSYKWSPEPYFPFGDNTASVKAKIVAPGTIYVTLSNDGCSVTDSLVLYPETCCAIMVPNVFSPNSDGLNDEFRIYSNTNQWINQISVYNRFGQRVFFTMDQNKGWDGTYNNGNAEPDVYYYFVSYKCSDGTTFVKKGDITLVR